MIASGFCFWTKSKANSGLLFSHCSAAVLDINFWEFAAELSLWVAFFLCYFRKKMAILGVFLVSLLVNMLDVQVHGYGGWSNAHATFYGGGDASGTMGHSTTTLQTQRRLILKSNPLGPPGVMQLRNHSPHVAAGEGRSGSGSGRNIMVGSPFATGVLVPDGVSIYYGAKSNLKYNDNAIYQPDGGYGLSDSACETSNPDARDDKRDGSIEEDEDEATLSRVVSPRDMATQMSPEGSTNSSRKGWLSFSAAAFTST